MGVYNHIILAKNMGPNVPLRHFFTFKDCGKFGHSHEDKLYNRQKFKISLYFSDLKKSPLASVFLPYLDQFIY